MSGPTSDTTRSERNHDVQKPRDVTTRKTRTWRRRILFSAAALGLAVLARRLRGRGRDRTIASGMDDDGERTTATGDAARSTTGDGGRSIGRRLAMAAASAAAMVAARRLRGRTP